uniref:NADH-ubiquinone oxidoreductase chain 5 n=1 Tax=Ogataea parapolymorpha (strain ATCC 26012 / BCRC 20466 / JCM 22074 / NRRL Y-7560 / DL-1) TaxID=871575 RepID=E7E830_OGAPD|nr:NADH dehydrogenase subunit 5 [Ogataea polymorpha]ADT63561.1 NADH dehydrogenase subunit 5 [Ogataea polymorpha]
MTNIMIFSSLFGTLFSGTTGRYMGVIYTRMFVFTTMFISLMFTYLLYFNMMMLNDEYMLNMVNWLNVDYLTMNWNFLFDKMSMSVLIPIVTVSTLVHLYAMYYMSHDPHQQRFFSYLSLFTFGMILTVMGDNLLMTFLGWETIGVASYLLISFWYTRINAAKSGLNSLLVNKIGDTFLVIGLGLTINVFGSLNYHTIFSTSLYIDNDMLTIMLICFIIACSAKSVQFGLHTWLTNSMEGPTPVSSLTHAACLVMAGVYLLIRCSYIIEYSPMALLIILTTGGVTTLMSGLIAMVSNDIKKIIALSTMSQISMMMLSMGISSYNLALFHLMCHSFFKALTFMSAGTIIHSVLHQSQDIRTYGGYTKFLPLSYTCMLIASLSLMAMPGLTGYYSKDIIIESLYGNYTTSGFIMFWFTLLSASLTSIYSIRLMYYMFYNTPNGPKYIYNNLSEGNNPFGMYVPMIMLAMFSMFAGYFLKDLYLGLGTPLYNNMFILPNNLSIIDTEYSLNPMIKLTPLMLSIILSTSLIIGYEYYYSYFFIYNNTMLSNMYWTFNQKYYYDQMFNNISTRGMLSMSLTLDRYIDKGMLMNMGPMGLYNTLLYYANKLNKLLFLNLGLIIELIFLSLFLIMLFNIKDINIIAMMTLVLMNM